MFHYFQKTVLGRNFKPWYRLKQNIFIKRLDTLWLRKGETIPTAVFKVRNHNLGKLKLAETATCLMTEVLLRSWSVNFTRNS